MCQKDKSRAGTFNVTSMSLFPSFPGAAAARYILIYITHKFVPGHSPERDGPNTKIVEREKKFFLTVQNIFIVWGGEIDFHFLSTIPVTTYRRSIDFLSFTCQ